MDVRSPVEKQIKWHKISMKIPKVFFKTCCKCNYDFRKTPMWTWLSDNGWDISRHWGCSSCFPDYQSVMKYLDIKEAPDDRS